MRRSEDSFEDSFETEAGPADSARRAIKRVSKTSAHAFPPSATSSSRPLGVSRRRRVSPNASADVSDSNRVADPNEDTVESNSVVRGSPFAPRDVREDVSKNASCRFSSSSSASSRPPPATPTSDVPRLRLRSSRVARAQRGATLAGSRSAFSRRSSARSAGKSIPGVKTHDASDEDSENPAFFRATTTRRRGHDPSAAASSGTVKRIFGVCALTSRCVSLGKKRIDAFESTLSPFCERVDV